MRFSTFIFPNSPSPEQDYDEIEATLREVELCEGIGMDAVWLAEHHFAGTAAYSDPVVFGAALAMRTKRIRICFGVLEMPMWHPVRLAVQTALLDNLSHGRLTVGTGPGTMVNEYEFLGFGLNMEERRAMLQEAEELLVKAWTQENVHHQGRYWDVTFPKLRPVPYQKPHPPIVRACHSESSMMEMAKIGRAILAPVLTPDERQKRFDAYQRTMVESGFDEPTVERVLDDSWDQRHLHIGDSNEEALEVAAQCLELRMEFQRNTERNFNPGGLSDWNAAQRPAATPEYATLAGTPKRVAEQVAELRDRGIRNLLLLHLASGYAPREQAERSMRLFGEKVMPLFQSR